VNASVLQMIEMLKSSPIYKQSVNLRGPMTDATPPERAESPRQR
jgi:hypothetical protein